MSSVRAKLRPAGCALARAAPMCFLALAMLGVSVAPACAAAATQSEASPDGVPTPDRKPEQPHANGHRGTIRPGGDAASQMVAGSGQIGQASWYGSRSMRKRTASGDRFDPKRFTAAHPTLPMHARVKVTNLTNGREVTVTINDRSKPSARRVIDLSPQAADALGMKHKGLVPVLVELQPPL